MVTYDAAGNPSSPSINDLIHNQRELVETWQRVARSGRDANLSCSAAIDKLVSLETLRLTLESHS